MERYSDKRKVYVAIDFGAGSGRVIAGHIENGRLETVEVSRFSNGPVEKCGVLCWDSERLFRDMLDGLARVKALGFMPVSLAIDTWGVDFALVDSDGKLLGDTVCYRDSRTSGMPEQFFSSISREDYYRVAGIQIMPINTIFQLMSLVRDCPETFADADSLLLMPDYFAFRLTGVRCNELTEASTSGLLDAVTGEWSRSVIGKASIPEHIFGKIVPPGTVIGTLLPEWAEYTGLGEIPVIAACSHDTASAVLAQPSETSDAAFLSSGTWSLLGMNMAGPVLSPEAMEAGFTNERGHSGITFLQNITGLWILQRLMSEWEARSEGLGYPELTALAESSPVSTVIDVDAPDFTAPESMEKAIVSYCVSEGLPVPEGKGQMAYCVLHSLAVRYRRGIDGLKSITGRDIKELNIIGGGSRNSLLNRLTAEETGLKVTAGPVEATAMGNILLQALSMGEVPDMESLRDIVRNSVEIETYGK